MKLLFDQNLSFKLCNRLADIFPDSKQVRGLILDQATDADIWNFAKTNDFSIVTLDSDFADLASVHGAPPKIIWLRCGNQATEVVEKLIRSREAAILEFLSDPDADCLEVY